MGYWQYVHDPQFKALLVSGFDGDTAKVCPPQEFPWADIHGREWVSHNREFDKHVFERCQALGIIPSGIAPRAWYCSAAASAYLQLPRSLAGAAKEALNITLDKAPRGAMKDSLFVDETFIAYCRKDAETCFQLWQKLSPFWPHHERELYELTCSMGNHGVMVDRAYLEASFNHLAKAVAECDRAIPFTPAGSIKAFQAACASRGITPPKSTSEDDPYFPRWLRENADTDAALWVRFMQRRRSLNRTMKVIETMIARIKPDGRMPYELKYFGANPGRWSGGGGLNMQNFNRKKVEGIDLRSSIIAPEGKVLGIVDYAQIESRVILFLAGDWETLAMVENGIDLYEAHARATMGYRDPQPLKEVDPNLRQLAKARVLGLGYGCGAEKFIEVARIMAGIEVSFEESSRIVKEYRKTNPKIVSLWNKLENTFRKYDGKTYQLPLPCTKYDKTMKRYLLYRNIDANAMTCRIAGEPTNTYGGKLVENWVQATARDILASAWLRCHKAGFTPVMSVHDELVFELPRETAEADLKTIIAIMEAPRKWAPGLPLKAEGIIRARYEK